ncbi:hypothetical protein J7T55_010188 [Diaporthe amygdali]|uniref:uncharacterized protein n=1 Tax=Phomopsis amygdali TaxID=1214568 RepID=UPI0022FE1A4A|nr:uncharacterized protein J7T55_010188 [Diaporthe amygdali]KAJ0113944.1 hypothetical protein J7T55_010188 [Diaporthe amygdali]
MASGQQSPPQSLDDFLRPLRITDNAVLELSRDLTEDFSRLSNKSDNQFLPTPISESLLGRVDGADRGRYLAIDIGGTNLRVGFVELLAGESGEPGESGGTGDTTDEDSPINGGGFSVFALGSPQSSQPPRLRRLLERSWPIGEQLKDQNADSLFKFIGKCISLIVQQATSEWGLHPDAELPMGVTFSFPMEQKSLHEAILMPMGKGFALDCKVDLGAYLVAGYEEYRENSLPRIRVAAIANDAVASLVSFIYQFRAKPNQKAAMSLICGTGTNATIPLKLSTLKDSKRPQTVSVIPGQAGNDVKIAVNTEWSINGTVNTLSSHGLITGWDTRLNMHVEKPGFQPLEYMTSGRYLGELGRIIFEDYLTKILRYDRFELPLKLREPFTLSTTFLSHFNPRNTENGTLVEQLQREFPIAKKKNAAHSIHDQLEWTPEIADALYRIAVAIEVRAAGLMAAYTIGLLTLSEDLPPITKRNSVDVDKVGSKSRGKPDELVVGYTGGCITAFQNYLKDCQAFLDSVVALEHGKGKFRVLLSPCHDGGITGAGILVPASLHSEGK